MDNNRKKNKYLNTNIRKKINFKQILNEEISIIILDLNHKKSCFKKLIEC